MDTLYKAYAAALGAVASFVTGIPAILWVLLVVLLAALLDLAVQTGAGASFSAVTGATCLWFIASEGVSILENAARMGLPIPQTLQKALEVMRGEE